MRNTRNNIIAGTIVAVVLILPNLAFAVENFVPLAPIPGVTDQPQLSGFLNAAFRIGIIVAAFLAVIMIAFGGLEYMVSSVPGIKTEGVGRIKNALWGLLLILFAYIILRTINPDILNLRFESELKSRRLTNEGANLIIPKPGTDVVSRVVTSQDSKQAQTQRDEIAQICKLKGGELLPPSYQLDGTEEIVCLKKR